MKNVDTTNLVVRGTTWFSSLAVLNLCWLVFSLPIVTLIPATDAVYEVLHHIETDEEPIHIFKSFRHYFKKNFWKSFKWGLPILILVIVIGLDLYILNNQSLTVAWFQVVKYAFYTLSLLLLLAVLFGYPLSKRMGERHIRFLLLGLLMAVGNPLVTLAVLAGLLILVIIFWYWPAMLFFFSLTGVAWIGTKAVSAVLKREAEK